MTHTALARVWIARDGLSLVPDGDHAACILLARTGQRIDAPHIARFPNAHRFFDGVPAPVVAGTPGEIEEAESGSAPRRGRPPKNRE